MVRVLITRILPESRSFNKTKVDTCSCILVLVHWRFQQHLTNNPSSSNKYNEIRAEASWPENLPSVPLEVKLTTCGDYWELSDKDNNQADNGSSLRVNSLSLFSCLSSVGRNRSTLVRKTWPVTTLRGDAQANILTTMQTGVKLGVGGLIQYNLIFVKGLHTSTEKSSWSHGLAGVNNKWWFNACVYWCMESLMFPPETDDVTIQRPCHALIDWWVLLSCCIMLPCQTFVCVCVFLGRGGGYVWLRFAFKCPCPLPASMGRTSTQKETNKQAVKSLITFGRSLQSGMSDDRRSVHYHSFCVCIFCCSKV